jgi:hypothetical protein
MHLYTFFGTQIVFSQTRYRFTDLPNSSAVNFVPYVISFSSRRIALFFAKLTYRFQSICFSRFHHQHRFNHPHHQRRCKNSNSRYPSDSLVPNLGCPGTLILFICPFVLRWETVMDRSPLSFQFSGYRHIVRSSTCHCWEFFLFISFRLNCAS